MLMVVVVVAAAAAVVEVVVAAAAGAAAYCSKFPVASSFVNIHSFVQQLTTVAVAYDQDTSHRRKYLTIFLINQLR